MRSRQVVMATLGCFLLFAPSLRADPSVEVHKAITVLYKKMDAAINRKDISGATAYYTSDYVAVDPNGKQSTLAQHRQNMQGAFQFLNDLKLATTIQKVSASGKTIVVTVSAHITGSIKDPQTHANKVFDVVEVDRDTWIKASQGWRMSREQTVSQHATMDGKPMPMGR